MAPRSAPAHCARPRRWRGSPRRSGRRALRRRRTRTPGSGGAPPRSSPWCPVRYPYGLPLLRRRPANARPPGCPPARGPATRNSAARTRELGRTYLLGAEPAAGAGGTWLPAPSPLPQFLVVASIGLERFAAVRPGDQVRQAEPGAAAGATQRTGGTTEPHVFMATGAAPLPRRLRQWHLGREGPARVGAHQLGFRAPLRPVAGFRARQGVGYFMQARVPDLIGVMQFGQVPAQGDHLLIEPAQAGPAFGPVEPDLPRVQPVSVQQRSAHRQRLIQIHRYPPPSARWRL